MDEIDQEIYENCKNGIEHIITQGELILQARERAVEELNKKLDAEHRMLMRNSIDWATKLMGPSFRAFIQFDDVDDGILTNDFFLRGIPDTVEIWVRYIKKPERDNNPFYVLPDDDGQFRSTSWKSSDIAETLAMSRRLFLKYQAKSKELQYQNIEQPEPSVDVITAIRKIVQDEIAAHLA